MKELENVEMSANLLLKNSDIVTTVRRVLTHLSIIDICAAAIASRLHDDACVGLSEPCLLFDTVRSDCWSRCLRGLYSVVLTFSTASPKNAAIFFLTDYQILLVSNSAVNV